ncbi:hypothetical protein C0995_011435 [Termitomyces sp. Mi166|nr:hypothetical protein C0995_011435 [Termitomyces sp. Mi166\
MEDPSALINAKAEPSTSLVNTESAVASNMTFQQPRDSPSSSDANIFSAAQRGDVDLLRELIESGRAKATDRDDQNITALHWAAINAHLPACKYLLEQGAEVDALGGDLVATPMQWAARNGYLYVIQLLIAHNADPTIADSQGYNSLHLVTHSSSIMPLLYLLHQPVNVDSRDSQGHTSLMWAAYQGDGLSVELLLKHGADPNAKDDAGLTPLHWAVVRGNRMIIRKLIEKGADLTVKDGEDRTPRDMAVELKSLGAWKRALEEGGMNEYGVKRGKPLSDRNTKIAIFILPTLFFYLMFMTLTLLPWYTGLLLAFAEFFGMHHIVTRVLLNNSTYTESVNTTPYFAGIIFGSMIWVLFCWFTRLVRQTQSHAFTHFSFAITVGLCVYNFFRSVTLDPGTCPRPANDGELRSIIEELASEGRLNGQTFCIQCIARKPLRSKHCRVCDKCIARSDHIILEIDSPHVSPTCVLPAELCTLTAYDTFLFSVAAWVTLQLSWTIVLLASQFWQIMRQMTTLEVSNLGRYGYMGGRGGQSLAGQMGHRHQHRSLSDTVVPGVDAEDTALVTGADTSHGHSVHRHSGLCAGCGSGFLMNLLGFDRFTKGRAVDGLARAGKASNPFDLGIVDNCKDFWTAGRELGVEYDKLYDVPIEGFREAKRRRDREDEDEGLGVHGARKGHRKSLFMGFGLGRASGSRAGYEPVSSV